jgi:hypothetical protein
LTHTTTVSLVVSTPGVQFDNAVKSGFVWSGNQATTPAFVIGTKANRAAMIMIVMVANNLTNITASLGGVPGTLVPGTDTGTATAMRTMIFQVINPPSGSQTATVTWSGSAGVDVGVITVSGANQTTPVNNGTFLATNSSATSTASLTVVGNPGDLTATVAFSNDRWISPYTNQRLVLGPDDSEAAWDIGSGNGTDTHGWMDQYAHQGASISGGNFQAAR